MLNCHHRCWHHRCTSRLWAAKIDTGGKTSHFSSCKSLDLRPGIAWNWPEAWNLPCFRRAHSCVATCQRFGCTVKPFIHAPALFQGEDLQHKHSNVSQNTPMFSEHMHSQPQLWICSGSFGCNPAQRQHFPSLQLILYFLIYAPCLGSVDYNYTKKRMASCILCHALIKNLITPLHHSCIQKSRY